MTSDEKEILRHKRMLSAGYIVYPEYQKILYNDGEMIQWMEKREDDVFSIHMADINEQLEFTVFELDHLIKAFKEFGINLKKE